MPIQNDEKRCPGCLGNMPAGNKYCCHKCWMKENDIVQYKKKFGEKVF